MSGEVAERTTVGIIGLGVMGSAMADQILSSDRFTVCGYDIDPERGGNLIAAGGSRCSDLAELLDTAELVLTSLPSVPAFHTVVGQLAERASPGTVVLETSTLPLADKLQARDALASRGILLLDCPLSGTGQQARDGDLVAYLSGDDAAISAVADLVEAFTRAHFRVGPFGSGTKMKVVANHLVAIHNVAAAEALTLADRLGLDLKDVLAAVGDGAGGSRMFQVRGPLMVDGRYEPATMRMDTFAKDLQIISDQAASVQSPTPLFRAAEDVYRTGLGEQRQAQDTASVFAVLNRNTGGTTTDNAKVENQGVNR